MNGGDTIVPHSLRLGCPRNEKKKFRFEPKQTETRSVSRLFRFVSWNQKKNFSVCFGVSNLYRNNRNKQNCFEMNRNNPECSEKSIIYLPRVLCLAYLLSYIYLGSSVFQPVCHPVCHPVDLSYYSCRCCGTLSYSIRFSNQTDQGIETESFEREGLEMER